MLMNLYANEYNLLAYFFYFKNLLKNIKNNKKAYG